MGKNDTVVSVAEAVADELPMKLEVRGYQKTVKQYAERYQRDERAVKRWKAAGKKAEAQGDGYLPPLDEPWKMPGWWSAHMRHKCPDHILDLAAATMPEDELPDADDADPVPLSAPVDLSGVEGVSDMGLSLMQKVASIRGKDLADAYAAGDTLKINAAAKRLNDVIKSLRMLEKTQSDMAKSGGALISKDMVRNEIVPVVNRLSTSFLPAMMKAVARLAPDIPREQVLDVCVEERDHCFSVLRGSLLEVA